MAEKQNFYATRLATDIGAGDTNFAVETVPVVTSGRLVLEARNPTQREIISFSGVSGNQLTGVMRGQGGTTAKPHLKNALVEMNMTAEDIDDLYDLFGTGTAVIDGAKLGDGTVTAEKISMTAEVDANGWTVFALGPIRVYSKRFTNVTSPSTTGNSQTNTTGGGGSGKVFPVGVAPADANWIADGTSTDGGSRWKFFMEGFDMNSTNTASTFSISARNLTTSTISMTGGVVNIVGVGLAS